MNKIKVSIAIPAYNEVRFIEDTLNSVVNEADEIVIGDNASTDGTSEVIAEFAKKYKHVRHIRHKENIGSIKNFEFVIEESNGEYVRLVGAHDIISKNSTSSMLKIFEENEDAGMVYSNIIAIDENKSYTKSFCFANIKNIRYDGDALARLLNFIILGNGYLLHGLYRKSDYVYFMRKSKIMEFGCTDGHFLSSILAQYKAYACKHSTYYFRDLSYSRRANSTKDVTVRYNKSFGGGAYSWQFAHVCSYYEQAKILTKEQQDFILELSIRKHILIFPNFIPELEKEMETYELCKVVEGKQELVNVVLNRIKEIQQLPPKSIIETILKFPFSNADIKEHVIFGAGKNGQHLIAEFSLSNIQVNYFCDNNASLHGKTILGAKCISFEELKQYKDSAIIYVSTAKADILYEQLKENGFKYVFPKELMGFVLTL